MPAALGERGATRPPVPLLTTAEARALGILAAPPLYRRIRRGVHVDAATWDALAPWQRYAVRVHALLLARPGAILCLESAAVILGLPLYGETRDIHTYDPERSSSRRDGDVVVHTSVDARDLVSVDGVTVTALLDTVVDLARVQAPVHALTTVDAAISPAQGGNLTLASLRDRAADHVNGRGRRRLSWALSNADELSESPGETASRAVMLWSGFERPVLQPVLRYEGHTDRVDFGFCSVRALGESDGWGKYGFGDPAAAERHLRREKVREDRLRRHGPPFARWELRDALRVDPLGRALSAAGVPLVRPADRAGLASLRRTSRVR